MYTLNDSVIDMYANHYHTQRISFVRLSVPIVMIVEFHVLCHSYVEMDNHKHRQLFPVTHVDVRTVHEMDFDAFHCVHYKWDLFQMFDVAQHMLFVVHFDLMIFVLHTVYNRLREEFLSLIVNSILVCMIIV